MRHPLHVLLRIGRSDAERHALRGDLEETYRREVRPARSWAGAQAWYARQVLAAFVCGVRDSVSVPRFRTGLVADTRYALRRWGRRPGFAVIAVLTLALGIAAATASFSLIDGVLLRPLPWKDPATLVYVHGVYPERRNDPARAMNWNRGTLSYPAWDALRTTAMFDCVAVWHALTREDMTFGDDRDALVRTASLSSNFLPLLGVKLALGRYFTEREDNVNSDSVILTWEAWQRRLGGRADVIGQRIPLGSASSGGRYPKTVVGVLEPGFRFEGEPPEILLPVGISAEVGRQYFGGSFRAIARLAPGVSREQAESAAAGLVGGIRASESGSARLVALADEQLGAARRPLLLIFGGAGLLLLIACSNVAGILLGEARARRHEIAVRTALGSGRARLVRQVLVEHALLAVLGTVLGLVLAGWLIGVVLAAAPEGLPRLANVRLDARAAWFAGATGLATLLVFGVAPSFSVARTPVAGTLAEGSREGGVSRVVGQRLVVVAQLALALVLLTGASLFGETIRRLTAQPLGFDPDGVAVIATTFTGPRFGDPARVRAARQAPVKDVGKVMNELARETSNIRDDQVFERIRALPGVTAVAGATGVPFISSQLALSIVLDGRPGTERHDTWRQTVSEEYFGAMRIRLASGRLFNQSDRGRDSAAAVVSREFERRFFPEGAVNRRFRQVYGAKFELSQPFHIVGVVEDVKRQEFSDEDRPTFYSFDRQMSGTPNTYYVVRAGGDVGSLLPSVRAAIAEVSPQLVVTSTASMEDRVARSIAEERFRALMSGGFAVAALVLSVVGLFGVMSRRTADRRREFGIRMALGARPADVGGLVLKDAGLLVALGLVLGLPAAYAAAQLAESLLFGISSTSTSVFAATAAALGAVAAIASVLPARRASVADPVAALRS